MRSALVIASLVAGACGGSGTPDGLRAGQGDAAFVRCLAADPPEDRTFTVASLRFEQRGRVLAITGAPAAPKLVIFAGPAPATTRLAPALAELAAADPDLILVLGNFGDDAATARRTIADLAAASAPVILIAGGRDDPEHLIAALAALAPPARDRLIDATTLRRVELAGDILIPLAGAPEGRYARTRNTCGFTSSDLDALIREATTAARGDERRWLASWSAPTGQGGLAHADAGSPLVTRAVTRLAPRATFSSWPDPRDIALHDRVLIVPPLAGLTLQHPDGARIPPRATLVTLGEHGPFVE